MRSWTKSSPPDDIPLSHSMASRLVCALLPAPAAQSSGLRTRRLRGMSLTEHSIAAVTGLGHGPVGLLGSAAAAFAAASTPSESSAAARVEHAGAASPLALPAASDDLPALLAPALAWAESLRADAILLHDLSRPLTPRSVMERVISSWRHTGHTAVPAVAVTDSVKAVQRGGDLVNIDRSTLVALQSPIVAPVAALRRVLAQGGSLSSLAHALRERGEPVQVVNGSQAGEPIMDELSLLRAQTAFTER